jgi:hypothetical protein
MTLRPELEPVPPRMSRLPLDHRNYPVPWFVPWVNGVAEFRAMDHRKFVQAIKERRCWICGERRGRFLTFCLGPMCTITRTTAEPPSHRECAIYAARNCPFLTRPRMVRRHDAFTEELKDQTAGVMIDRNPGVVALWTTFTFELFDDGSGKTLLSVGEPARAVEWYCEGRLATREEVVASIQSGYPLLQEQCDQEATPERCAAAQLALAKQHDASLRWLPTI